MRPGGAQPPGGLAPGSRVRRGVGRGRAGPVSCQAWLAAGAIPEGLGTAPDSPVCSGPCTLWYPATPQGTGP